MAQDSKQAFGGRPDRDHHQHHIHELGEDTLKPIREFVAAYKKHSAGHSRIETLLVEVLEKLDAISAGTDDKVELEAFRTVAYPTMVRVSNQLDAATPGD